MIDIKDKIDNNLLVLCELHGVSISFSFSNEKVAEPYVAFESESEYLVLHKNFTLVKVLCSAYPDGTIDYKKNTDKADSLKFVIDFFGLYNIKPDIC